MVAQNTYSSAISSDQVNGTNFYNPNEKEL